MSTPPPFGPPPGGPPPVAPPSWQVSGAPAPELASKPSRRVPIIVGALVVAVAVVVAVLVLGGSKGGSTSQRLPFDARAARRGAKKILDDATYDDNGSATLTACPFGETKGLYNAISDVIDVDSAVRDGGEQNLAKQVEGDPGVVSCDLSAKDSTSVAKGPFDLYFEAVVDPPTNYKRYIVDLATDEFPVHFQDVSPYAGGMVYRFCWSPGTDRAGCEADWVDADDRVALTVYLGGDQMKADDALAAMQAVLTSMGTNLAMPFDGVS